MALSLLKSARLWSIVLCSLAMFGGYRYVDTKVPSQHVPWKPLSLSADIGWATKTQLLKLSLAPRAQCVALIGDDAQNTIYSVLDEKRTTNGCGWEVAIAFTQNNDVQFTPNLVTNLCPMTAATHIWLGEVNRLAMETFAVPLARIHHFGTYSCRNIGGTSRLSEHAFANAWDVSGFELEDGRLISVLKDWDGDPARRAFLRAARDSGCGLYRVVLSPDYNAAHADHFHFDMGPSTTCR